MLNVDVNALASVSSAIGTVLAAGVAAYSARLAWKQVGFQFAPKLTISSESFQIRTTNSLAEDFWWRAPSSEAKYINGGSENYRLTILNIGNGPAFDVRIFADFDFQILKRDVLAKLEHHIPTLKLVRDNFGYQILLGDKILGGFRLPEEAAGHVEMIGGNGTLERKQHCPIDPSLEFFASCYAQYLRLAGHLEENARNAQIIPVNFRIEYLDSSGTRHVDSRSMKLTIRGGRYKSDGSDGVSLISLTDAIT